MDDDDVLQLSGQPRAERADAARNRKLVLEAAGQLFSERGVDGITVDAVAQTAGVGKATVFRRFGDKSGLVAALLGEQERRLQGAVISGEPPLGPGAPSDQRALAFLDAYITYLADHLELIRLSETAAPGARYRIGAYRLWHRHLEFLCGRTPDPGHLAHAILAMVDADLNMALLAEGYDWDRIRASIRELVTRILC